MNATTPSIPRVPAGQHRVGLLAAALATLVAAGCATTPTSPPGAAEVRRKLDQLEGDATLASQAPVAMQDAATAVRLAEQPLANDPDLGAHRVFMADRKVEIARARAQARSAEEQRRTLAEERGSARLVARTEEADRARGQVAAAEDRAAAEAAEAAELQREVDSLKAEATERGLVVTLGDVLFTTGRSDLNGRAPASLDKLVAFLQRYPNRRVEVEGHTDDVGSEAANQGLSERRANTVMGYLVRAGISDARVSAAGFGERQPVAANSSSDGRQQNRRVVLVIVDPAATAAASPR
jgi:outer membrane protein OmpA-like peptidoglycan-associated protein